jgi:hypothetical protein
MLVFDRYFRAKVDSSKFLSNEVKEMVRNDDFSLIHNPYEINKQIETIQRLLNGTRDLTKRERAMLESGIKERILLMEEINKNRKEMEMVEDINNTNSTSPIDIAISCKIKEQHYDGYIRRERAEEMIHHLDIKP